MKKERIPIVFQIVRSFQAWKYLHPHACANDYFRLKCLSDFEVELAENIFNAVEKARQPNANP